MGCYWLHDKKLYGRKGKLNEQWFPMKKSEAAWERLRFFVI
jgi:hypothetical protein